MPLRTGTIELGKATEVKQKERKYFSLEKSKIESALIAKRRRLIAQRDSLNAEIHKIDGNLRKLNR